MRTLKLALLLLLPAGAVSAQHLSASKAPAGRMSPKKLITVKSRPEVLQVGDTCYVTSKALHLRDEPNANSFASMAFEHGKDLIVREIVSSNWILIVSYSEDVGIIGFVFRKYVSKTKP